MKYGASNLEPRSLRADKLPTMNNLNRNTFTNTLSDVTELSELRQENCSIESLQKRI